MLKQFIVTISQTARRAGNNSDWQIYNQDTIFCEDEKELKEQLKDRYFYCKTRQKMYRDDDSGEAMQSGYIYCWKGQEREDNGEPQTYLYQDWVSVHQIKKQDYFLNY